MKKEEKTLYQKIIGENIKDYRCICFKILIWLAAINESLPAEKRLNEEEIDRLSNRLTYLYYQES